MYNWAMKNVTQQSFVNATLTVVYVIAVAAFMTNAEHWFGQMNSVLSAASFLLLFTLSAFVVGGLLVIKPLLLYIDGAKKEAVKLFVLSGVWLAIWLAVGLCIVTIW